MSVLPTDVPDGALATPESCGDLPSTVTTPTDLLPADSEEEMYHAERLLANGDFYSGQWCGNLPHGTGKYLWTDGCMYMGEWHHGKTMGKGTFSWPSGGTYEGEFKSGFMEGYGTYTGSLGDTYRGTWSMNLKHGHGVKSYANGDYYDGEWRSGVQDGHGRYVWKNGNEYDGHWRAGAIDGHGTLVWANGNRYEGGWENGLPKGDGSFRWADGGVYVGHWSKDNGSLQQKGVYYPSPTASSPTARDPHGVFSADLGDCKVSTGDNASALPPQKAVNRSGRPDLLQKQAALRFSKSADSRPRRRASVEVVPIGGVPRCSNRHANTVIGTWNNNGVSDADELTDCGVENEGGVEGEAEVSVDDILGGLRFDDAEPKGVGRTQQPIKWTPREMKKQGEAISKGHKNYELLIILSSLMSSYHDYSVVGRHAVGRLPEPKTLDLKTSAFDPKEKIWTRFPPEGTKQTPPHQSCEFKWKDYCPLVFRSLAMASLFLFRLITLRKLFRVDPADYMMSICGNDVLRELSSPGKSGSFFYLTNDDRYMIKTMKKSEVKVSACSAILGVSNAGLSYLRLLQVLLRMLPAYYNHFRAFENTLVTKFFGLHCVKLTGAAQRKVGLVFDVSSVKPNL
ncbi:hypothetical protein BHE74_00017508 [Ensete ventricosum]|nr:hypothetical protein BHE74_00017508 [Ensete ventricosum]